MTTLLAGTSNVPAMGVASMSSELMLVFSRTTVTKTPLGHTIRWNQHGLLAGVSNGNQNNKRYIFYIFMINCFKLLNNSSWICIPEYLYSIGLLLRIEAFRVDTICWIIECSGKDPGFSSNAGCSLPGIPVLLTRL